MSNLAWTNFKSHAMSERSVCKLTLNRIPFITRKLAYILPEELEESKQNKSTN